MSAIDHAAFFIPLVFIAVLWRARGHFLQHPVALGSLLLLTLVSILHFDVGMLATDPYDVALDDIGAPAWTWSASVIALILLSYSGDAWERVRGVAGGPHQGGSRRRAARGSRARRSQPHSQQGGSS